MNTTTVLFEQTALELIQKHGFSVFPLKGKQPLTKHGFKDATRDPLQVQAWAKRFPSANVGIATGEASGIVVIDIDDMNALAQLNLPPTLTVTTGKGQHHYYRLNGQAIPNSAGSLAKGVDVRGNGGYVVGPGSQHPDTKSFYRVLEDLPIAPLPGFLAAKLAKQTPLSAGHARDNKAYLEATVRAACQDIETCLQGGRNDLLVRKAYHLGRYIGGGLLSEQEVTDALIQAGLACGLEESEVRKTVAGGIAKGKENKRDTVPAPTRITRLRPAILRMRERPADDIVLCCLRDQEMGDAELFAQRVRGYKLFDHSIGKWMTYDGGVWQRDQTEQTTGECYDLLKESYLTTLGHKQEEYLDLTRQNLDDQAKQVDEVMKALKTRIAALGGAGRIKNVLGLAQGKLPSVTADYDTQRYLFNVQNGTLNLKTRSMHPHASEDMLTKISPVPWSADAECPRWTLFLYTVCNKDVNVMRYLQKMCGLFLSGSVDHQFLFFLYGDGANGKSTFIQVLQMILNDAFVTIPIETVLAQRGRSGDDYNIARLKGARLAIASEIPENRRLNESLVKDLTGNDIITARSIYKEPIQFSPTHKLLIYGNHQPRVGSRDYGIWRRLRLIPFLTTIPKEKRRPMEDVLAEFQEEASGILNWMVEGFALLEQEGLHMPEAIQQATDTYRSEQDNLEAFLQERLVEGGKVKLSELYETYDKWCHAMGERPSVEGSRRMSKVLEKKNYHLAKSTGGNMFLMNFHLKEEVYEVSG